MGRESVRGLIGQRSEFLQRRDVEHRLHQKFFSFRFSSSSIRRRLASDTSMPPYLAFQLYSVAPETPYLRGRSPVFAPASCSRRTAIICSSENLFRFIRPLPQKRPDSNSPWRKSS